MTLSDPEVTAFFEVEHLGPDDKYDINASHIVSIS